MLVQVNWCLYFVPFMDVGTVIIKKLHFLRCLMLEVILNLL